MSSIQTLIDLFIDTPSLANARKLVAKTTHNPMSMCLISEDHAGMVRNAERMVADAKNPAKLKETMQAELRARFKGINIEVI
jgi:hypothetical protein